MEKILHLRIYITDKNNSVSKRINSFYTTKIFIYRLLLKLTKYFPVSAVYATREIQACNKVAFIELLTKNIVEKVIFNDAELIGTSFSKIQLQLIPVKCFRS